MRNKRYIFFLLCVFFSSCSDYFSPESDSNFTTDKVFSDVNLTGQAITGIYSAMCDDNLYSKKLSLYLSLNTDIEYISGNTDNGRRAIARYTATASNTEIEGIWSSLYSAIGSANNCIEGIRNSDLLINGDDATKEQMLEYLGEALTLRAVLYFDLVKNWGDVPFHNHPTTSYESISIEATNRYQILDSLITDLKEAESYLNWVNKNNTIEKISKDFAKGLRAKIALFRGGYSIDPTTNEVSRPSDYRNYYKIADTECAEIIQEGIHSLNPSYENIFKAQCAYKQDLTYYEPLFELAMGRLNKSELGYFIGVKHDEDSPYGKAEAGVLTTPSYFYSFNKNDERRDVSCAFHQYAGSEQKLTDITSITLAKWRKEWITPIMTGTSKYTGINFTFMRYADVLLMYAEAENEINNGPTLKAKEALKTVRNRAFPDSLQSVEVENYVDSLTSKESFFNALVNERAWEFSGESIRKYDLIRWGILSAKLNECENELKLIQTGSAPYEFVPQKVYWKLSADNEHIIVANIDQNYVNNSYDLTDTKSTNWASKLSTTFINKVYEGNPALKQFIPIPQQAITDSNGLLINHYGY